MKVYVAGTDLEPNTQGVAVIPTICLRLLTCELPHGDEHASSVSAQLGQHTAQAYSVDEVVEIP